MPIRRTVAVLILPVLLNACGGSVTPSPGTPLAATAPPLSPMALLGQKIFHDASLSASGALSCASCHNPANAHAPLNTLAVQTGGAGMDQPGLRSAPSLRYLELNPVFAFAPDGRPKGGYNRDGRVPTLSEQAQRPLLAAHEMANASKDDAAARLRKTTYVAEFTQIFGAAIFATPDDAFDRMTFALAQFQKEDPRFHPYDSRYDAYLAGKTMLSAAETRGLGLFNDPNKGNCAACHPSAVVDGTAPLFTDFGFDNLGVPRNRTIPANSDPAYFDLGLCGPQRTDLAARTDLCGAFKVPTLRNVATRAVFFHNGVFGSLSEVVAFYARRDTSPAEWYPAGADGRPDKFNDLPPALRGNVNTRTAPYGRSPGMAPALNEAEIADIVSFLQTLTDGYRLP